MSTKTISLSEEAYKSLSSFKEEGESFTDVVNRLTKEKSLLEVAGVLSKKEADELRNRVKERREKTREGIETKAERLE